MKPAVTIERRESDFRVLVTVRDRAVKLWTERNVDDALDHFCREYRWAATKAAATAPIERPIAGDLLAEPTPARFC